MKKIIGTTEELSAQIAAEVAALLERKPDAVLGFAAPDVPASVYEAIAGSGASFEKATAFCACEYAGAAGHGAQSQRAALMRSLFEKTPFAAVYAPDPDAEESDAAAYDARIRDSGGLDLLLLGLGVRGHVAFAEPGALFCGETYVVKLADATREAAAAAFGGVEQTPARGVTMGIETMMKAKKILLIATGAERAQAVQKTLEGRPESFIPASYLQLHTDVQLYLDSAAASQG